METAKPWLKHYQKGVPESINPGHYRSVPHLLEAACRKHGKAPAFANMGATITYAELDRLSSDFAAFLRSLPGMERGERVAIMMPNLLQYPVAIFGVLRAGLVAVNVNPLYTERELEHQLQDSGARAILVLENFAAKVQSVLAATALEHVIVTQVGDLFRLPKRVLTNIAVTHIKKMVPRWHIPQAVFFLQALATGQARAFPDINPHAEDIAFLQYTGGTTGSAKGVML
ncbi:MAG TPA: AMP-binding protein, partial [Burkholderiaceae bacterium]|nr:AMP-binding protein [Burkholderiaceae bacterium]